jgi:uncharacterized protein (DUF427 family)
MSIQVVKVDKERPERDATWIYNTPEEALRKFNALASARPFGVRLVVRDRATSQQLAEYERR